MQKSGIRSETKARFDSLLKTTLKKKTKSKQNLVSDVESVSSSEAPQAAGTADVDIHREGDLSVENKAYILDKFLHDSSHEQEPVEVLPVKAPVPKPRKAKGSPGILVPESMEMDVLNSGSNETFVVPEARVRRSRVNPAGAKIADKPRAGKGDGDVVTIMRDTTDDSRTSRDVTSDDLSATGAASDHRKIGLNESDDSRIVRVVRDASRVSDDSVSDEAVLTVEKPAHEVIELKEVVSHKLRPKKNRLKARETSNLAPTYDYNKIISVTVHKSDRLLLDSFVVHPVVKVHLVDSSSGEYMKKSDKNRNIVFYYENKDIDYIGPILTQAYSLQENRSLHPNWEETILINEDFNFLTGNYSIIMILEIMDFLSTAVIRQSAQRGQLGWHRIAWGFLKLSSPSFSNVGQKVRLQLYYPAMPKKNLPPERCDVFHWWQKQKLRKYPSTLQVTVKGVISPTAVVETLRSRAPHEVERGRSPVSENGEIDAPENDKGVTVKGVSAKGRGSSSWSRQENQVCKLPVKCTVKYDSYDEGCFAMTFSNDGLHLACSVLQDSTYVVGVYNVLTDEIVANLAGHQGLIYCISWSGDDRLMITASSDCTVSIWDMKTFKFLQMLPHPSFVYSSVIHGNHIITGCYDTFVRVWSFDESLEYELQEELKGHAGYVTSLCFNKNGTMFYSSDSVGVINVWKFSDNQWQLRKEIKVVDLKGIVINQVLLHKRERRLLVNSRDSKIRLVDIKTGYILQTYSNALNNRIHISCTLTPCGTYVLSGSENGDVYAWNTETGRIEHTYKPYRLSVVINCVQYHPKDNIVAVGHYGNNLPILVFKYTKEADDQSSAKSSVPDAQDKTDVSCSTSRSRRVSGDVQRENALNFREILEKMDLMMK